MMGMIVLCGCEKQSSCEGEIQGYLQVLDEPYITDSKFYERNVKITAHFYQNKNHEGSFYCITGKVPKKIPSNTLVTAKISSVYPKGGEIYHTDASVWIYKLDCFFEGE